MNARSDSLFRKLQEAKDAKGRPADYLNQLMIFLEDPPLDVSDGAEIKEAGFNPNKVSLDRFQKGADMVNAWGIKCGRTAVWSLYKSYALYWRMLVANGAAQTTEEISSFDEKTRRMAAQRTLEMLSDPEMPPKILVGLARLQIERQRVENDTRKVAVLEKKVQETQAVLGDGKLSKEDRDAKLKAIFGM